MVRNYKIKIYFYNTGYNWNILMYVIIQLMVITIFGLQDKTMQGFDVLVFVGAANHRGHLDVPSVVVVIFF